MADINVLDLTSTTPGSNDSMILFDRTTGEGKSTRFDTLTSQVLGSKFGDSNPAAGQELSYDATTGKYKNTSEIASLKQDLTNLQSDLTSIKITGSTNNTGSTIPVDTFFYLNKVLVRATTGIANGATLTLNTNYEVVTAGGLNALSASLKYTVETDGTPTKIRLEKVGKLRILTFNRAAYSAIQNFYNNMSRNDKPSSYHFSTVMRNGSGSQYMTLAFLYIGENIIEARHFAQYNQATSEGVLGSTDIVIGEIVYFV